MDFAGVVRGHEKRDCETMILQFSGSTKSAKTFLEMAHADIYPLNKAGIDSLAVWAALFVSHRNASEKVASHLL